MNETHSNIEYDFDRRDFLKMSAAAGLGTALLGSSYSGCAHSTMKKPPAQFTVPRINPVRIGYVGVGGMGSAHVRNLLNIKGVEIRAICDIIPERVLKNQNRVVEAGQPRPEGYSRGEYDFKRLCERDDLDLVYTATPWEWHVPVCVAAMEAGKHAATEVPAAVTLDECWQLVETSERTRRYCIMMENCCYDRSELLILNMVRKGVLGEIIHGECGYLHDLRSLKFDFDAKGEALWRTEHSIKRDGNPYPTHGLGPIAQCMNINRSDRFDYLTSLSSNEFGLSLHAKYKYPEWSDRHFTLGDMNTTLIKYSLS